MPEPNEKQTREVSVQLSGALQFTKVGDILYFQGTGLDPGTWTGIDDHTTKYDAGLIASKAHEFAPKKVKSVKTVHQQQASDVVGWTTGFKINEKGGVDVEGYVFDGEEIHHLETMTASGQQIGLSPELTCPSAWDPTAGIWLAQDLTVKAFDFVPNPACKSCWVSFTEARELSGGPVSGLLPGQTPASGEKQGGKGDNNMTDEGIPKTLGEALALFEDAEDLSDSDKKLMEFHKFLADKQAEGKSLDESMEAWRELQKPVEEPKVVSPEKLPVQPPKTEVPPGPGTPIKLMEPEVQEKLLAAVDTVNAFAEQQRLLTLNKIEELKGKIAEVDKTVNVDNLLAAFGEGNEAAKLAVLEQYFASISHFKSTVPEPRRELGGVGPTELDAVSAKYFGVEKYDLAAIEKKMFG